MDRNKKLLMSLAVLVIIAAVGWYAYEHRGGPVPDTTTYTSRLFSFTYPRSYELMEYATGAVYVGTRDGENYNPQVEVIRYKSDPDSALPPSFDAFVQRQAQNLCAADGPTESISCSNPHAEPFTTASGVPGQKLSLTLTRKNLQTGTTTTATYAPFYVFNETATSTAEDPLRYDAIFVYPSLPAFIASTTAPALIDQIIATLQLPGGVTRVGQPAK